MAEQTGISWADHTHNHWVGCMKVGPACDGCYAEHFMDTRMHRVQWGAPGKGVGTRALSSEANRRKPLAWNRKAAKDGTRPFVFCSSLADVFDNAVPIAWRRELFDLIRATPNLTWLLLTKRPQNIVKLYMDQQWSRVPPDQDTIPKAELTWPKNAAIGCTVVTQAEADRDIPRLLAAKATLSPAFAFVSMEPLLGPVDLTGLCTGWHFVDALAGRKYHDAPEGVHSATEACASIDWVITGGETDQGAHKARPSHPDWFRSLRDQCADAGLPFHFKQWGEWAQDGEASIPMAARARDFPAGTIEVVNDKFAMGGIGGGRQAIGLRKIGKKAAGRLLDGVEHNDRPRISA